ncbi:antitoxin [Patescibacteria group bacterium]|nr:antitoxin [Patescibacteria group bacterium]
MKHIKLDKEEKQILKDFETGQFVSIKNLESAKRKYATIAKETLKKSKNINIRLTEKDLLKVKSKAAEQGMPYQTLLASLIHQYADNKLKYSSI